MFANKNTFTEVSNWAAKNGMDLQAESRATENSLKTKRMDLFAKVQRVENAIEEGYAKNPDANYHRMPKDEQIAHKKALAQNVVMINEVYNNGSPEDKQAIENWLRSNGINPSKLKDGMTISDLIYQERPKDATLYFKLGKDLKENKNTLSHNAKEIADVFDATANTPNLTNVSISKENNIAQEQENQRSLQMDR